MTQKLELPVTIEPLAEWEYLAQCPKISGCHADGKTIGQALDNLRDVTRVIYELCQEQNLIFVKDHPEIELDLGLTLQEWLGDDLVINV
jgi:predicted RNase H-like HicB family nuclease